LFLHNTGALGDFTNIKRRLAPIDTAGRELGILRDNGPIQQYARIPNDCSLANNALLADLNVGSNLHGHDDGTFIDENVRSDFDGDVAKLVVLLFERRFYYYALGEDYVAADEDFGQVRPQDYLLVDYCVVVDLDVVRTLYKAFL
jgi:hypothetical protein